jgi:hypothetical protein
MKNQYFGDINDYLKYGLLRCFAESGLRIGVCWMRTVDDGRSDGSKIKYLSTPEQWRSYDPILFDDLAEAIKQQVRDVLRAQKPGFIPDALFFNELVPDDQQLRQVWLTKALAKLKGVELLFFDPDNGIEVQSKPWGRTGSCKYLYWQEIQRGWSQGSSLLIFQHFPRQNRQEYVSHLSSKVAIHLRGSNIFPLVTSNVVYLLACQPQHKVEIGVAIDTIAKRWASQIWKECAV